jgi:hypothetical protein
MYIAISDTGVSAVADTQQVAMAQLTDLLVDAVAGFAAEDEVDVCECRVCPAIPRRWVDVRDSYPWTHMEDAPDYDDVEATVYEEGFVLYRVTVTIRFNSSTEEWEADQ